jgi:hypothetical protein
MHDLHQPLPAGEAETGIPDFVRRGHPLYNAVTDAGVIPHVLHRDFETRGRSA